MSNHLSTPLRRVSILAIDRVFASTLMQAKDFFHLASLRHGKQLGQGLNASFETRLVSPDGKPVTSFSDVVLPVDGALEDTDIIILPAFGDDFDTLCQRYPQVVPWLREQHARGAVLCAEATGVFWLAEAGLLLDKAMGGVVPLRRALENGDMVEIVTSASQHPNPGWRELVVSSRAPANAVSSAMPNQVRA